MICNLCNEKMSFRTSKNKFYEKYFCARCITTIYTDLTYFDIYINNNLLKLRDDGKSLYIWLENNFQNKIEINLVDNFKDQINNLKLENIYEDLENILNKILMLKEFL
jgi:hypothetical protein